MDWSAWDLNLRLLERSVLNNLSLIRKIYGGNGLIIQKVRAVILRRPRSQTTFVLIENFSLVVQVHVSIFLVRVPACKLRRSTSMRLKWDAARSWNAPICVVYDPAPEVVTLSLPFKGRVVNLDDLVFLERLAASVGWLVQWSDVVIPESMLVNSLQICLLLHQVFNLLSYDVDSVLVEHHDSGLIRDRQIHLVLSILRKNLLDDSVSQIFAVTFMDQGWGKLVALDCQLVFN